MGYYASTSFAFKLNNKEALDVAVYGRDPDATDPEEVLNEMIREIGEEADWSFDGDGVSFSGWTGGKYYDDGADTLIEMLSGFATGIIDGHGEDDSFWRTRLFKDGRAETFGGEIVYPGDPGEEE